MRTLTIKSTRSETETLTFSFPDHAPVVSYGILIGTVVVEVTRPLYPLITPKEVKAQANAFQKDFIGAIKEHRENLKTLSGMEIATAKLNQLCISVLQLEGSGPSAQVVQACKDLPNEGAKTLAILREKVAKMPANYELLFHDVCKLVSWLRVAPLEIKVKEQQATAIPSAPPMADVQDEPPSYDEALALPKN